MESKRSHVTGIVILGKVYYRYDTPKRMKTRNRSIVGQSALDQKTPSPESCKSISEESCANQAKPQVN